MKKPTLEQVNKLASQLSPEERQELFLFLAQLPDSAIKTSVEVSLPLAPNEKKKFAEAAKTDQMYVLASDRVAAVFQRGRLIFQVGFYPENFLRSRMEIHSWKDSQDTGWVHSEVQRALELLERTDVTQDELEDKTREEMHKAFEKQAIELASDISRLLPTFARILSEAGIIIADVGNRNKTFAQSGFPKYTLEYVAKLLGPEWKQIKDMLNLKPGGRINVRHHWTKTDYLCLHKHHERLKPIWGEAKRIARQAQKSKEPKRRARWKEEVAETYRAEALPADLIEHTSLPDEWPPSDLALVHAGRLCVPDVSPPYSLKVLKEKLKLSKREKEPHQKSSKTGTVH
jgi:DNA-binding transcriptional MerR regulator